MFSRTVLIMAALLAGLLAPAARAFDLQAHRGGRGLMPENTLAAFEHALRLGVTTLEMDVAITADGVAVISHDVALHPGLTRDAQGRWLASTGPLIRSLTLAQLQAYDVGRQNPEHPYTRAFPAQQARDGERIPTLAAVFRRVKELGAREVQFDIETKLSPNRPGDTAPPELFVQVMLAAIREADVVERVMIQSFDWRTLRLFQAAEPRLRTMYLTTERPNGSNVADPAWTGGRRLADFASVAHMVKDAGGTIWAPSHTDLDEAEVKAAQALGLQVMPWTVNETADMQRLIDWKVDGIITDYPDRLREVMRRRGMALPAGLQP